MSNTKDSKDLTSSSKENISALAVSFLNGRLASKYSDVTDQSSLRVVDTIDGLGKISSSSVNRANFMRGGVVAVPSMLDGINRAGKTISDEAFNEIIASSNVNDNHQNILHLIRRLQNMSINEAMGGEENRKVLLNVVGQDLELLGNVNAKEFADNVRYAEFNRHIDAVIKMTLPDEMQKSLSSNKVAIFGIKMRQIYNLLEKSGSRDRNEELAKESKLSNSIDSKKRTWYQKYNQNRIQERAKNTIGYRQ